jgi:hypothetical protein
MADNWKRLNFLYTTGEKLLAAETLKDLTVRDDERKILWKALRERAAEKQEYIEWKSFQKSWMTPNC